MGLDRVQQLLWIETLLKLSGGLVLILMPLTAIKVFGLPKTDSGFWPRLLGAVLIGLAAAIYIEGRFGGASRGLGIAGCLLVNLSAAGIIIAQMVLTRPELTRSELGRTAPTARGQIILWLLVALLLLLSAFEIAHV